MRTCTEDTVKHYININMFAKEIYANVWQQISIFFFSKNMMHLFSYKARNVSSVTYDYACHFFFVNVLRDCLQSRRSLRASAFYKKGPARGAKGGAYPSSVRWKWGVFPSDENFHSIDLTLRFGRIAVAEPICVAPTSSGLPGTAFRVPRAVGGYADPPVAHGVPYSEYI